MLLHNTKSLLVSLTGLLFALVLTCCLALEPEDSLFNKEEKNDLLQDDLSSFATSSSALLKSSSSSPKPSLRRGRQRQQQRILRRLEEESSNELVENPVISNNTEIHVAPYEFPEIDCKDFSNFNGFCPTASTDADADGCCHGDNMFTKSSCNRIYRGNAPLASQYCFWCCDGIMLGTESPSSIPTSFPSQVPSGSPSLSMAPSTSEPSLLPSGEPSLFPSGEPSVSALPSASVLPSHAPSTSIKPSNMPSIQPSTSFPSFQPSTSFPSNIPTSSLAPSNTPSNSPTIMPPYPKFDDCSTLNNTDVICGRPRLQGCCEEKDNLPYCDHIYESHPNDIGSICYWCCDGKLLDPSVTQQSQSPSESPTTKPSTSPTTKPSTSPTFKPTHIPTKAPITLAPVTASPVTASPVTTTPVTPPPTKQTPFTGSYICSAGLKKDQFCITADDCGSGNPCIPEPALNSKYMVGSYYYPWHGPDFHGGQYLREYLTPKQVPELGEYDDTKADIIGRHLAWTRVVAKSNLWVTSWAGPSERRDNTIKNNILKHPNLPGTKISLFYETLSRIRQKTILIPQIDVNGTIMKDENGTIITKEDIYIDTSKPGPDMEYMAKTYFEDPNYLRINDRPVIFVYVTRSLAAYGILEQVITDFREAAKKVGYPSIYIVGDQTWNKAPKSPYEPFKLLDAVTNYDVYGNMGRQPGYSQQANVDAYYKDQKGWHDEAKKQKCSFIPGTSPGYNDRGTRLAANHPGTSRKLTATSEFGSLFQTMMEQAIEIADPDVGNMIMITSFNEWHEDTQIEPVKVTQAPTGNATNPDLISPDFLTYEGYGEKYLEIIRNVTTPS